MLAGTNAETDLLNDLARDAAIAAGMVRGPSIDIDGNPFQIGDRIVLTQNMGGQVDLDTGHTTTVDNGMIATITRIDHQSGEIDIALVNERQLRLASGYVEADHIDYGYATTFHKAQGLTCDDVFVVGPAGMFRESGYVALSRARNEAHLYATTKDAAAIGERGHSTGIPLPTEHAGSPEADMVGTLEMSKAKQFAIAEQPNLAVIADTAHAHTIGELTERLSEINRISQRLRKQGHTDPTRALDRLDRAIRHRAVMHVGGRVNALDRDNIGTVEHLLDNCGHAHVRFISSDGNRTYSKVMAWENLRPIDHPDPADLTPEAEQYLVELDEVLTGELHEWSRALNQHGIEPGDHDLIEAAIDQRQRQQLHALRATPPEWLRWWVGDRPADPIGAAMYDEHVSDLAAYRDTHHLPDDVPGYGPQPSHSDLADEWRRLVDRALDTRNWLAQHQPHLDRQDLEPLDLAAARARIDELDALFDTAPPDVARLIDDLANGTELDEPARIAALADATKRQEARADWILEHWPNVIEHLELTAIVEPAGPLDHWPTALDPDAQHLYSQLAAISVDATEERSLIDLDQARWEASPIHQVDGHQREHDINHDRIADLRAVTEPVGIEVARQHIARLRGRNEELRALINHAENLQRFIDWGDSPSPELDAAIERRTTHLAHAAITTHSAWVTELTRTAHTNNPDITADDFHQLVHDVAAYRERAALVGTDAIGARPDWDHPLLEEYDALATQLEIGVVSPDPGFHIEAL
jgi:hypothetical protein